MLRMLLTRSILILATASLFLPFLPGDKRDAWGRGGISSFLATNRALAAEAVDGTGRDALLRFKGKVSRQRTQTLNKMVKKLHTFAESTAADKNVCLQVRGFFRNDLFVLAYDLYPVRVKGRPLDQGGTHNDPVLEDANWVLSQRKRGPVLEKVKRRTDPLDP